MHSQNIIAKVVLFQSLVLRTSLRISAFKLLSNAVSDSVDSAVLIATEDPVRLKVGTELPTKAEVGTERPRIVRATFLKSIVVF